MVKTLKGRIVDIDKRQNRISYITQGIKGSEQWRYQNYPGGHGTYVTGGEYLGTSLYVKIWIYSLNKCLTFDVYDQIKHILGTERISKKTLVTIKSHIGDKVDLLLTGDNQCGFGARILLEPIYQQASTSAF